MSGSVSLEQGQINASSSAILPKSLFNQIDNETVTLIFGAYESPALFKEIRLENSTFEVASIILTIAIADHEIKNLTDDVEITMSLLSEVYSGSRSIVFEMRNG